VSLPGNFLTLLPPPAEWPKEKVEEYVNLAVNLTIKLGDAAVNVPEVIPYGRKGNRPLPFRPKMDLLKFARMLKSRGLRVYVDRHVPLMEREEFHRFLKGSRNVADGVVVVGRVTSRMKNPGYAAVEGIRLAREYFADVGAITIFERDREVERVCGKVRAGATFFLSQITFYPGRVREFIYALKVECERRGLRFPKVYVSVAPVYEKRDRELLKWMDVDLPPIPPDLITLVREIKNTPGVAGINYEHIRYPNLPRLHDLNFPV